MAAKNIDSLVESLL